MSFAAVAFVMAATASCGEAAPYGFATCARGIAPAITSAVTTTVIGDRDRMRFSNVGEPVYGDRFLEFWSGKDVGLQIRAKRNLTKIVPSIL